MSLSDILNNPLILKELEVLLLSGVKFFFAVPLALGLGFSYWQTVITTSMGGILGIFVFYFLSPAILRIINYLYHGFRKIVGLRDKRHHKKKHKRKFTFRNKTIIRLRGRLGMFGIVFLTPILLSIPLGCVLANKYYSDHKFVIPSLCLSVVAWSFILTTAFFFNYI